MQRSRENKNSNIRSLVFFACACIVHHLLTARKVRGKRICLDTTAQFDKSFLALEKVGHTRAQMRSYRVRPALKGTFFLEYVCIALTRVSRSHCPADQREKKPWDDTLGPHDGPRVLSVWRGMSTRKWKRHLRLVGLLFLLSNLQPTHMSLWRAVSPHHTWVKKRLCIFPTNIFFGYEVSGERSSRTKYPLRTFSAPFSSRQDVSSSSGTSLFPPPPFLPCVLNAGERDGGVKSRPSSPSCSKRPDSHSHAPGFNRFKFGGFGTGTCCTLSLHTGVQRSHPLPS